MAPSRATPGGRAYLDLQRLARNDRRPVDELLQFYVLESLLARLAASRFAEQFVLKGGVLLAVFGQRRPTRDVDLQAQYLDRDTENAEVIRDEDPYPGVRVTMTAQLATALLHFHVDVNVGDPITPAPQRVHIPRLLGGEVVLRGYPLVMVFAEKIVTAIARGTVSTRWRDFADMYLLARHHVVPGTDLARSIRGVAEHRQVQLVTLGHVLDGYGEIGQARWAAWRRKQRLDDRLPERFSEVVSAVVDFADPVIANTASGLSWEPTVAAWS